MPEAITKTAFDDYVRNSLVPQYLKVVSIETSQGHAGIGVEFESIIPGDVLDEKPKSRKIFLSVPNAAQLDKALRKALRELFYGKSETDGDELF